jgi:membrane-associated phospholipid phosphatase
MALTWLRSADEEFSRIVFETSLPKILEVILSVPGNWFGLAPSVLVGPLWIATVLESNEKSTALYAVTLVLSLAFLAAWYAFLQGNYTVMKFALVGKEGYLLATPCSVALCYGLIPDSRTFSIAIYPVFLWTPAVISCMILKKSVLRKRPCAKYTHLIDRKCFKVIPKLLAKVGADGSFPSIDAAIATAFAIPLATQQPVMAASFVILACFGRLYFLAHHAVDTIGGVLVTCIIHFVFSSLGLDMKELNWWHPLIGHICLLVYFFTSKGSTR